MKAEINEKHLELVKSIIFYPDNNVRFHVSLVVTRQNVFFYSFLPGTFYFFTIFTCHIAPLDYHLFWSFRKFLLTKNISILWKTKKCNLSSSLLKKRFLEKLLGRWNNKVAWKMAEKKKLYKMLNIQFYKDNVKHFFIKSLFIFTY